jgi:hypothetical protein
MRARGQPSRLVSSGLLLISLLTVLGLWLRPALSVMPEPAIPTTAITWDEHHARLPDWSRLTFRTLPPILSEGSFQSTPDINRMLDYDLSRSWQAGQTADSYLKLGDFQTSLYPQVLNLHTIAQISQIDLRQVALGALEMASWQTVEDLVTAIPGLGNYRVSEVPPIQDLFTLGASFPGTPGINPHLPRPGLEEGGTIADILSSFPELGQLKLGQLGEQLNAFAITDIPGLENAPLRNLRNWGNSTISGVPGLADLPLDQMPNPISAAGALGQVDVAYGPAETNRSDTISGSNQQGFEVPCTTQCAYAELTGSPELHGKQWVSGQHQKVQGGEGILSMVNGGQEPTGRHPFGDAFKVAVWDVDEATGTISTALFFRICQQGGFFTPDLGCTPYFLGPVPFLSYRETEFMLVGPLDAQGGASAPASIPADVWQRAQAFGIPANALPGFGSFMDGLGLCGEGPGGVDFGALAAAFSSIEGNYGSVGTYVCDGDGNCGRGLGRYQYMSYRSDVRATIRQEPGGAAFLARVDSGAAISRSDIDRFFPPSSQDGIFKADQTRNIQQAQREGFSGQRLIERVGQIHFGGSGAPIDGNASDIHGRLTLKSYGESLSQVYSQAVASGSGKSCMVAEATPSGATNERIMQSLHAMGQFSSAAGPDGGNLACAWAVNRVLTNAGIPALGSNPNYVPSVEAALQGSRGTQITQSQAQAGDIVIAPGAAHIGICLNAGCTRVRSNSSSRARFAWDSDFNFGGFYGRGQSRVYRLVE